MATLTGHQPCDKSSSLVSSLGSESARSRRTNAKVMDYQLIDGPSTVVPLLPHRAKGQRRQAIPFDFEKEDDVDLDG
ncbi:hypothetical protein HAX54_010448, partial [Datura stramonium]|nr:hypothetical protein [Datura stramonium]